MLIADYGIDFARLPRLEEIPGLNAKTLSAGFTRNPTEIHDRENLTQRREGAKNSLPLFLAPWRLCVRYSLLVAAPILESLHSHQSEKPEKRCKCCIQVCTYE